jgi:hypothetical protein
MSRMPHRKELIDKGYLTLLKRGRKPLYNTPEEAHNALVEYRRAANHSYYRRYKEACDRYLEDLSRGAPSELGTSEPSAP